MHRPTTDSTFAKTPHPFPPSLPPPITPLTSRGALLLLLGREGGGDVVNDAHVGGQGVHGLNLGGGGGSSDGSGGGHLCGGLQGALWRGERGLCNS